MACLMFFAMFVAIFIAWTAPLNYTSTNLAVGFGQTQSNLSDQTTSDINVLDCWFVSAIAIKRMRCASESDD